MFVIWKRFRTNAAESRVSRGAAAAGIYTVAPSETSSLLLQAAAAASQWLPVCLISLSRSSFKPELSWMEARDAHVALCPPVARNHSMISSIILQGYVSGSLFRNLPSPKKLIIVRPFFFSNP